MKWNQHIFKLTAKANRTLGFIRRNLSSCSRHLKFLAYKTLIRPLLEYSSSVWDPFTQLLIDRIEAVQRRAARFIMKNYSRFSSVSEMLDELELEPLSTRRVIDRLVNFHKAREGKLAVPVQTLLHPVRRHTRHSNRNNFIQIRANKNCSVINIHSYQIQPEIGTTYRNIYQTLKKAKTSRKKSSSTTSNANNIS